MVLQNLIKTQPDWHNIINANNAIIGDSLTLAADVTYDAGGNAYIVAINNLSPDVASGIPATLPETFSVRCRFPNDFQAGAVLRIGAVDFTPQGAGFKAGDVAVVNFDRVSNQAFFSSGMDLTRASQESVDDIAAATEVIKRDVEAILRRVTPVRPVNARMGVAWNFTNPSPNLVRLDDAVGLVATAGIGAAQGFSDFDEMPVYKDIRRCNVNASGVVTAYEGQAGFSYTAADVMVEIPLFYYRIEQDTTQRREWISNVPTSGFTVHPAFARPWGNAPYIYVGAYETGAGHVSRSGLAPLVSITRDQFRIGARGKGTNWSLQDLTTRMALELLVKIEFANLNTQAVIGGGNTATAAALLTGRTNSIIGTGREAGANANGLSVVWRGIENPYGNVWEFVDGFNVNAGQMLFANDPANYADDTATNYTPIAIPLPASGSGTYATRLGFDVLQPWAGLPSANAGGSETTFLCDCYWFSASGWRLAVVGGYWNSGGGAGLFAWHVGSASSLVVAHVGARLLCIPR
ncbi:MAG: hypothetical protein FWE91_09100 [Defluviitaleaceae bacterium]|nr:hypothetical protein [Defluviitaleaceae bacterium]MCL2835791.1 hypothetical protein [Defluviitaleaceae bacterium]